MSAEGKTLWSLSAFFLLLAVLYGVTSQEPAGTVLLALCAVTTTVAAVPLRTRRAGGAAELEDDPGGDHIAPVHEAPVESLWPFVTGIGTILLVNGLVLGPWLLVPGLALIGRGLVGIFTAPRPHHPHPDPD